LARRKMDECRDRVGYDRLRAMDQLGAEITPSQ
jgi:hypothetical protein